jgi:ComF family protein
VQPVDEPPRGATDAAGCTHLSGIRSAGVYKPPLSLAIRRFKYRGRTDLAASLGRLMAQAWQSNPRPIDFVAPIPLHEKRLAERGYNQAALLAAELCRAAHLPLVAPGLLTRQKDTEHQVQLGLEERQRNVKDAFVWIGPPLTGATVLLIDDVATTGSTLEACAEALIHAGAGSVHALTVARAVLKDGARAAAADGSRRTKEG